MYIKSFKKKKRKSYLKKTSLNITNRIFQYSFSNINKEK